MRVVTEFEAIIEQTSQPPGRGKQRSKTDREGHMG
ncbi:Uncharacterised protein [Vibrio cholerae]|nr:Uncharacterised protein [Vibrio cholerae]